ncbi:MAG: anti-sigma factor family protein [Acidimicrobiia bacterium]
MRHPTELVSAYLDGELTGAEREQFIVHVGSCGRCARELEEVQAVRAAVRSLPVLELPRGLIPEADADIVPLHRHRGVWVGAVAAVLVLVVTIAALVTPAPAPLTAEDLVSRFGARVSLDPAFGPAKVVGPQVPEVVSE